MIPRCLILAAFVASAAAAARADVKLPAIFGDNMVLQAGREVPVWGTAEPGEEVEVRVSATRAEQGQDSATAATEVQTARTQADEKGAWRLSLRPLTATNEPIGFVVTGKNKLTFENVIVGDVWVCSGQSNMEWPVSAAANPGEEIANAKFPTIRLFTVEKAVAADKPAGDVVGKWFVCGPETIAEFSAVGYYFGREVQAATGEPVGLIDSTWGGTPAESWTSREKLASDEAFKPILDRWTAIDEKAAAGQSAGEDWSGKLGPEHPHHPATLYNAMLAPLVPYAIKGAIWYQGESNADRAYQYRKLLPAMITDWRERWGQGDFPFLFVQLANFMERKPEPGPSAWAELREAQHMTLSLPNTGEAVIIDIGDAADIHPKNKQDVGKRLARAALKVAYGKEDVVASGPTLKEAKFENGKAVLLFDNVGAGLKSEDGELKGFALAGDDQEFKWASARIAEGPPDVVVVSSPEVPNPVAVRYAWADNPEATLYNSEELPASPFRTDTWEGVTEKNQ